MLVMEILFQFTVCFYICILCPQMYWS